MSVARFFRYARLAYFAKPSCDRQLFRLVRGVGVRRIVEVGIGSLERTGRMLALAHDYADDEVLYTGIDPFEERASDLARLPLIEAHRGLRGLGATVRLCPGGPAAAGAMANSMTDTDLLLLSGDQTKQELESLWRYVPRMCHPGTRVLRGGLEAWEEVSLETICRLGDQQPKARAA